MRFIHVDRLELLKHLSRSCVITEHVEAEVTYPEQQTKLAAAIASGVLTKVSVSEPEELSLFARLIETGALGAGECSAISLAICNGMSLGIHDKRAFRDARNLANELQKPLEIWDMKDIVLDLIRSQRLPLVEADAMLHSWAQDHKFKLNLDSFADLIPVKGD
jgi:predicted nucleic acid-binding protein